MHGADILIRARFLTLVSHLCASITLLWGTEELVQPCLPKVSDENLFNMYHSRFKIGLASSVTLIILELANFMYGITLSTPFICLISAATHAGGSLALTYFVVTGWLCNAYWPIYVVCTVFPCAVDGANALITVTNEHEHLTKSNEYTAGWSFYLVLAGVVTTFGSSLPVGYNIGVINTPAKVIQNFCNESFIDRYDVVLDKQWMDVLWSFVVSIFIVGGCTGSILGAYLADNLGRKRATIATSLLWIVGALFFLLCRKANSVEMLIIGRLIVGLAGGLTTSIVPMYLTELAPFRLTGAMGVACPMGVNVGVFVGQVMGLNFLLGGPDDWPYLLAVYAVLVIICLPVLFMLPESPKYLYIIKRDEEKSLEELSRLRGTSSSMLTSELESLREEAAAAAITQRWSMLQVAREPTLLLPLLLVVAVQAGQQTSGINAVFYYSQTIFEEGGLTSSQAQLATIAAGFVNVCTAVWMVRLLPRTGRRPLLLWSVLSAAILLALLAATLMFIKAVSWMPYVCTVAVLSYVIAYGFGLGPIPYFIASELFEVGPRPAAMAWGSLGNWGGNFLVGMTFKTMNNTIGTHSFFVFSAVTAALYIFIRLYFPETRGKTPTQVSLLCNNGFRSRPLRASRLQDNGV